MLRFWTLLVSYTIFTLTVHKYFLSLILSDFLGRHYGYVYLLRLQGWVDFSVGIYVKLPYLIPSYVNIYGWSEKYACSFINSLLVLPTN